MFYRCLNDTLQRFTITSPMFYRCLNVALMMLYRYLFTTFTLLFLWFLLVCGSVEPVGRVCIMCPLNRLYEFYSLLSPGSKESVDKCFFLSFFKCPQAGMSGFLMEYLLDVNQIKGNLSLMVLKLDLGRHNLNFRIEYRLPCHKKTLLSSLIQRKGFCWS